MTSLEPNLSEKLWDKAHYWAIRVHRRVDAVAVLSWQLQRALYYKWAKHYQTRCEAEWALQDDVRKGTE